MSTPSSRSTERVRRRRRRLTRTIAIVALALFVAIGVTVWALTRPAAVPAPEETAPAAAPAPEPEPLTPAQQLLADSSDPAACAVSFAGEGVPAEPQLQSEGALYAALPIPDREGSVFAGWYATAEDAAALAVPGRVNGAEKVACTDREITLHAAWVSPEQNAAEEARIPILMYHQFTTRPEGEDGWLRGNYAYIGDFEQHMDYLATGGFYLPTWDELNAFVDGRLFLPNRSVIITDDDADPTWYDLAVPIVDRLGLLTTSFMITVDNQLPSPSTFVLTRSHTNDMHRAGDNGQGLMTNLSAEEIAADLDASAAIVGAKEVVAYPFGHYNDTTKEGVALAGYWFGRTIEPGYVSIGTDRYALPVIRVNYGDTLADLQGAIG